MVPLRLSLSGFMSYEEEQELSFEGGSLFVLAGPNGAGKSTLFDAITYALYGQTRAERGEGGVHLINHRASRLRVRFDFRLDEVEYRVERTMNRAYRRNKEEREPVKTRQAMRRGPDGTWQVIPGTDREEEFRRWLRRTLGLDYEAFTTAVLLQQGQSEKLLDADPAGRREILSQLIGLSRFERLYERVSEIRSDLERQRRDLERKLAEMADVAPEEIEAVREAVDAAEAAIREREAELRALIELRVHAQQWERWTRDRDELLLRQREEERLLGRAEEIRACFRRLEELQKVLGTLARLVQQGDQLQELRRKEDVLKEEVEHLAARETAARKGLDELEKKQEHLGEQREALREQERAVADELARLRGLAERWRVVERLRDRCEGARRQLAQLPADLAEQVAEAEARDRACAEARTALPWLRQIDDRRARLRKEREEEEERVRGLEALGRTLDGLALEMRELEAAWKQAQDRERELLGSRSAVEEALRHLTARQARFDQAAQTALCELCGQAIDPAHAASERARLQRDLEEAERQRANARSAHAASEKERERLQMLLQERRDRHRDLEQQRDRCAMALEEGRQRQEALVRELQEAAEHLPDRFRALLGEDLTASRYPSGEDLAALAAEGRHAAARTRVLGALREQLAEQRRCAASLREAEGELAHLLQESPEQELLAATRRAEAHDRQRGELAKARGLIEEEIGALRRRVAAAREESTSTSRTREEAARKLLACQTGRQAREEEREATRALLPPRWRREIARDELTALEEEARRLAPQAALHAALEEAERGGVREQLADLERRLEATPARARRPEVEVASELATLAARIEAERSALRRLQDRLQELERWRRERADLQRRRDEVAEEHVLHDKLARLLGPKGLQRWLLQQAERAIVEQANETLHDLTGGGLWLKLQPDEESKKALDLLVCNRETSDRPMPIAMCSGSQRFRIAISLALSTGRYLSREARRVESVIIDEGFGCLDKERRADMVEAMKALRGKLTCIILVSHQEEFTSSFTQGYRVELRGRSSVVVPLGVS